MLEGFAKVFFENARFAVCVLDREFKVVWANAAFSAMYNLSGEEAIGKTCFAVTHGQSGPCDLSVWRCPLREVIQTGKRVEMKHVHPGHDGLMHYVKSLAFQFGDYFAIITQDITEHELALQKIKELEKELEGARTGLNSLSGFLPICSSCKKIRSKEGNWNQIEMYIRDHSDAEFTHGICPECAKRFFPHLGG